MYVSSDSDAGKLFKLFDMRQTKLVRDFRDTNIHIYSIRSLLLLANFSNEKTIVKARNGF